MTTYLRHTPTGDLYPFNDNLARRDDMVAYTPPPEGGVETPAQVAKVEEELVVKPVQPVKVAKKSATKTEDELPNLDDL